MEIETYEIGRGTEVRWVCLTLAPVLEERCECLRWRNEVSLLVRVFWVGEREPNTEFWMSSSYAWLALTWCLHPLARAAALEQCD